MPSPRCTSLLTLLALLLLVGLDAHAARLKDIATIRGVRSNQLLGYGLVVGLQGTGDDQQVYFMLRSVQLMLRRLGVQAADDKTFDLRALRLRNTATVMVTAELPPFSRAGGRIDLSVAALGNATSLQGGTLLMTPLRGVDLKIYAIGQGAVSIGGYAVTGRTGSRLSQGHSNAGRIPGGGLVEREVSSRFSVKGLIIVALSRPDFTTATLLAEAVNKELKEELAAAVDPATVQVRIPKGYSGKEMLLAARMERVEVQPDTPAQVIINERTGTVVVGQEVRISPVAISHGSLTLEVNERYRVSQPRAVAGTGATAVTPDTRVKASEGSGELKLLPGAANLTDVVKVLNALGASPRDLMAILQALEAAGAMTAKVTVQ
jgi:flagellar P-ring protein FlgI